MTLEQRTALVAKELTEGWRDSVIDLLSLSDLEIDKSYSFDSNEAISILDEFVRTYCGN